MLSFFFQAEDGIRDVAVTGVQTCALPIWTRAPPRAGRGDDHAPPGVELGPELQVALGGYEARPVAHAAVQQAVVRSEERRVGKECRSRRWPQEPRKRQHEYDGRHLVRRRRGQLAERGLTAPQ